jgi:hypothetical protein
MNQVEICLLFFFCSIFLYIIYLLQHRSYSFIKLHRQETNRAQLHNRSKKLSDSCFHKKKKKQKKKLIICHRELDSITSHSCHQHTKKWMLLFCFFSRAFSAFVDMFYNCSEMDTRTMWIAQTQNSLTIIYNNRI